MNLRFFKALLKFLEQPYQVFIFCLVLVVFNVILDGTLFQMRKMYLNRKHIEQKTLEIQTKDQVIVEKLNNLSNPVYLEKEIRDRFDLVGQGDLIFIFPDE